MKTTLKKFTLAALCGSLSLVAVFASACNFGGNTSNGGSSNSNATNGNYANDDTSNGNTSDGGTDNNTDDTDTIVNDGNGDKVSITNLAKQVVSALLVKPEPWSFLPEAFKEENMAYSSMPASAADMRDSFVNVGTFGKRLIGKQMNVVYDILERTESALNPANLIFTAGDTIASLYQSYIDSNPQDIDEYSGSVTLGGVNFKLKILSQSAAAKLLIGSSSISVELSSQTVNGIKTQTGRIQLTDGIALKYERTDNTLKLAVKYTVNGTGMLQQLDFARNGAAVAGHFYEYVGTESNGLATSALIASNSTVTAIISDKRETDDLKTQAYEELYNSQTGEMIGGEVEETVETEVSGKTVKVDYDTLWINLYHLTGISSVKVNPAQNGLNADTIYINGNSEAIQTMTVGIWGGTKATSRRFDIEMKDVWYIVTQNDNGKTTYSKQKASIPMLFVQRDNLSTLSADFKEKNDTALTVTANTSYITTYFDNLKEDFLALKGSVSYGTINSYVGDKDVFFN